MYIHAVKVQNTCITKTEMIATLIDFGSLSSTFNTFLNQATRTL